MVEGVKFGGLRIQSLLSSVAVVLLASSNSDLLFALGSFETESEAGGVKISNSKSEVMVLSWKKARLSTLGWGRVAAPSEGTLGLVYD